MVTIGKNNKNSNDFEENARELGTLSKKELVKRAEKFSSQYCVGDGKGFKLKDYETKASFAAKERENLDWDQWAERLQTYY